jgi:hypothetical protein
MKQETERRRVAADERMASERAEVERQRLAEQAREKERQRQRTEAQRLQTAEEQLIEQDHEEILAYMRQNLPVVKNLKNGAWYDPVRGVLAANPSKEGRLYRLQGRIATVGRDYKMTTATLTYYFLLNNAGVLGWEKGNGDYTALTKLKVLGGSPPGLTTIGGS